MTDEEGRMAYGDDLPNDGWDFAKDDAEFVVADEIIDTTVVKDKWSDGWMLTIGRRREILDLEITPAKWSPGESQSISIDIDALNDVLEPHGLKVVPTR